MTPANAYSNTFPIDGLLLILFYDVALENISPEIINLDFFNPTTNCLPELDGITPGLFRYVLNLTYCVQVMNSR
jgi:hypothetical protein